MATGPNHLEMTENRTLHYVTEPADYPFYPSVDVFFNSLAINWCDPGVAVLLTGMGKDGANGMLALRNSGWYTIAQDQATSAIYGMPKAAAEKNAALEVLPLHLIGSAVLRQLEQKKGKGAFFDKFDAK